MAAHRAAGDESAAIEWPEWHADLPWNELDTAHAFTAFAPMSVLKAWWLKWKFIALKIAPRTELRRHHFVYFGRWTVPRLPGTKMWGDRHVLIETNFNGSFAEYLDTLSIDLRDNLKRIWGPCHGCPPSMWPPAEWRDWARRHELPAQHYYCAYPEATVKQIDIELIAERLKSRSQAQQAIRMPPKVTLRDWLRSLRGLVHPTQAAPVGVHRGQARKCTVSAVTSLTPVLPERKDDLRKHLAEIEARARGGEGSPFQGVKGTHCARWVIVDYLMKDEKDGPVRTDLDPPLLLFGVIGDGTPREYLAELARSIGEAGRRVWTDYCEGGDDDPLDQYLYRHRLKGGLLFAGYRASVEDVWHVVENVAP